MNPKKNYHGTTKALGCNHLNLGSFCRMFPKLKPWSDEIGITEQCEVEAIMAGLGGPGGLMHDADNTSPDSDLPAGYTFFAQFVDHDITLDTRSKLHKGPKDDANKVDDLPNLRSASLDMDCVYGFGPEASPHLYDSRQHGRLLTGNKHNPNDLARNEDDTALIGDPRNDENIYVSQLQLMFIRFHNKRLMGRSFEEAQKDCRYHYQWIVLNDYLARICDKDVYNYARNEIENGALPKTDLVDKCHRICMPVEFSVAAYRFGHTTVRSVYPANTANPVVELFDERFGTIGFSHVPENLTIDWRYLLDVEKCHEYTKAKAFDQLLPDELIRMPDPIVGRFVADNDRSLAFRNLLRGYALGLPCGQSVADALRNLGYPIPVKGPDFTKVPGWQCLEASLQKKLAKHTPLFFYLMVEAGQLGKGKQLGPVASAILMEVFGAMLLHCDTYLKEKKKWQPDRCVSGDKALTLADIARYVSE